MMEIGLYCPNCFATNLSDVIIEAPLSTMRALAPPATIPSVFFVSAAEFMAIGEALDLPVANATFVCGNCGTSTFLKRGEEIRNR